MFVWVFNTGIQNMKFIKSCSEWKHFYFKLLKYTILKLINLRLQLSDLALISAKLLRKNNTNQSWVGLHTHYFWCNIYWNFPMLSVFEELHWMMQKTACWSQNFNTARAQTRIWIHTQWLALQLLMNVLQWCLLNLGQPTLKGCFCEVD